MKNDMGRWMNSPRAKGCNKANMRFLIEAKGAYKELGRAAMMLYFLANELGVKEVWPLMKSASSQRGFVWTVIKHFKTYRVDPEWENEIAANLERIYQRIARITKILEENLRLTEYWPWYENVGMRRLVDYSIDYPEDPKEANEVLLAEIHDYNERHADEVEAYKESIAEEVAAIAARKKQKVEDVKLSKKAARAAKKLADNEVKEIQRNEEKHKAEERRIERSFAYLYK